MKDVNAILLEKFYSAIKTAVGADVPVYEAMAPPTETASEYVVINYPICIDTSTKSTSDLRCTIQIDTHGYGNTVVESTAINTICNNILQAIKGAPDSNINLGSGFQMSNISLFNDKTDGPYELSNRVYLTRKQIFQFNVFIK